MPKIDKYVIKQFGEELYWNHGKWVKINQADFFNQTAVDEDREYINQHLSIWNFAKINQDGSLEIIR